MTIDNELLNKYDGLEDSLNYGRELARNQDFTLNKESFLYKLPTENIKYAKLEEFITNVCGLSIEKRTFLYYIELGLLPPSIPTGKKNTALYSSEHILLYYLINGLKKYMSLIDIKSSLDKLFSNPLFDNSKNFRISMLRIIVDSYLNSINIAKELKQPMSELMTKVMVEENERLTKDETESESDKLILDYFLRIYGWSMGLAFSEIFLKMGFELLNQFVEENSTSISKIEGGNESLREFFDEFLENRD